MKSRKLTDQIRQAFIESGIARAQICRDTGLDKTALSRFVSGERFLSANALDTLAVYFGWELKVRKGKR